jgi:hypothetical protein
LEYKLRVKKNRKVFVLNTDINKCRTLFGEIDSCVAIYDFLLKRILLFINHLSTNCCFIISILFVS